jgi:hypothetical protein
MVNIYYIGGSPCSGKSTTAEILSQKYGLYYFKVDERLDKYTKMGASKGYTICKKLESMNAEEIWMREPELQCKEELLFYEEVFEFLLGDLKQIKGKNIITEGAAYLPKLMKKVNIPTGRYISITPEKNFQISHFKMREFVPYVLDGCSNMEKAFSNWMDRDILFAQEVQRQCYEEGYVSLINHDGIGIDEIVDKVVEHLGLEDAYGKK